MKTYSPQAAQDLALQAFQYLADDGELVEALLNATGLQPADLRQALSTPEFALSLLDFLLEDDQRVLGLADALNIPPTEVMAARIALAGPGHYGWNAD